MKKTAVSVFISLCLVSSAWALDGSVETLSFTGPVTGQAVNFSIYLPPGYDQSSDLYPVVYHLHGLGGSHNSKQVETVAESFEESLNLGTIGPTIIVFPDGYKNSFWADSYDMTKPAETNLIQELLPYVDSNYRTLTGGEYRAIEGHSMGGFGAAKFASKYPDRFCSSIIYDGAFFDWISLNSLFPDVAEEIFNNDEEYFNQNAPWYWVEQNKNLLLYGMPFRQVVGFLTGANSAWRDYLQSYSISVDYVETECGHPLSCLIEAEGDNSWAFIATEFPLEGESGIIESGDYNGDGTSDIAIFRESSGLWAVRGTTRVYFGTSGDLPIPGDYDGDMTTDISVFRGSSGLWAIRDLSRTYFGGLIDQPIPGDYDGDGSCDIGIFRESSGLWAIKEITRVYFGGSLDSPAPGYYDGASTKEIGIFREASGLWAIKGISRVYFGIGGDEAVPGDYDGSGTWEIGVFRPASGLWAVRGVTRSYFGGSSDRPVPADYNGDGADDIGIFRESSGLWAINSVTRVYFGTTGDVPVTR